MKLINLSFTRTHTYFPLEMLANSLQKFARLINVITVYYVYYVYQLLIAISIFPRLLLIAAASH